MSEAGKVREAAAAIRRVVGEEPFATAIILGSGLGDLAEQVESLCIFSYDELDAFPSSRVAGHAGRLVAGRFAGERVLVFQGRHHLYEGYSAREVVAPVRLAHELGCRRLLLTNASGGINPDFRPGDFMLIADHLNFLGDNPLRGETCDPFIDLVGLYRQDFYLSLHDYAQQQGIRVHRGILAAFPGPSYETPAEIRALALLGADAVSMSTVPEAIMGRYLQMEVAALSCIANAAAGLSAAPLCHEDVLASGRRAAAQLVPLVRRLIMLWAGSSDDIS